ncbi:hypothetical protein [Streptomyces sp. MJM1172]|uniref:hypothetical protein n=1 Tax=Streptomyces sp. MJM1172 TaxID=1703926 RepID=UPI0009A17B22|nr:hypothetical protein [Streptomyces sp. MJM1172]
MAQRKTAVPEQWVDCGGVGKADSGERETAQPIYRAERIDRTYRPAKRVRSRLADEFPLPADVLRRLATDPDPRMRQLAPRDPDLPVESARRLAADPDHTVRRTIATHPRLPAEDLTRLLADPSESVAATAAANPTHNHTNDHPGHQSRQTPLQY